MLAKDDMMPVLLDACPSFAPTWLELLAEWRGENDLPLYVGLGDLARHLIGLVERGETDELPAVFRVVVRWHVEGDEYVREAATANKSLHLTGAASRLSGYTVSPAAPAGELCRSATGGRRWLKGWASSS